MIMSCLRPRADFSALRLTTPVSLKIFFSAMRSFLAGVLPQKEVQLAEYFRKCRFRSLRTKNVVVCTLDSLTKWFVLVCRMAAKILAKVTLVDLLSIKTLEANNLFWVVSFLLEEVALGQEFQVFMREYLSMHSGLRKRPGS